jgi:Astacin (Peptidase family M12A)/Abnormal spindle-like microcephaly-assoc'd, ASPM-SPD-2-Hydin
VSLRPFSLWLVGLLCLFSLVTPAVLAKNSSSKPVSRGELHTGFYRGRPVTYTLVHGKAMYEGDIVLERVDSTPLPGGFAQGVAYSNLWLRVGGVYQIPYVITNAATNLSAAMTSFNNTFPGLIQFVPHGSEPDYVNFNFDGTNHNGVCDAIIGRAGGAQPAGGSVDCTVGTLLHEMGHIVGFWHEQARSDRDTYLTVNYNNVIKASRSNFDQVLDNAQNLTLYDYRSVMSYIPFAFSRNGGPTLESIPAGMPLSNLTGYTEADIDAVHRLYNSAPTSVTVTSNPPGLQVIIDGSTVATPQVFSWALNSSHTLDIPSGSQTLGGITYTYGRWNDATASSHSIIVAPGNGMVTQPATSPAVTVYSANFIRLVPYAAAVSPVGTGTITASPLPQAFPPASGLFLPARQLETLTATPNPGQNFYENINSPFWIEGGLSANPHMFYVMDDGNGINLTSYFTSSPVTTITTNPNASRTGVTVDDGVDNFFWYAPKSFALPYDSGWTAGSSHAITVATIQQPWSSNTRFRFSSWSDGGLQTHNITAPSSNMTFTANLTGEYVPAFFVYETCAGTLGDSPSSPTGDGFYPSGSLLTFTEGTNTGWTFTGFQFDLTGTTNPQNLTINDEELVTADFNTTTAPLAVTSLSPPSASSGGAGFTLTINGTGFTNKSQVVVNGFFRASTFVSSTQLQVAMTPADLTTPGAFPIAVENFPTGVTCGTGQNVPFVPKTFFVLTGTGGGTPTVTLTPASLTFTAQAIGTTSAAKTVTVKNTGSGVLSSSIVVSGDYAQTNNCSSLAAGASCTVSVTFTPTVAGSIKGALTVTDNAANSPQVVGITGTASSPLSFTPPSLAFGTVAVGATSAGKTVTLTNNLATSLNLSFAATGNYNVSGSGTKPCGAALAGKATCTLTATFQPTSNGSVTGAIILTHNAAYSPQTVALSGTGSGGATAPLKFSPATLSFTNQLVGTTSAAKTVTVTNSSAAAVTISPLTTSGNYVVAGSGSSPCGGSLAKAAKCTFAVTFSPTINGTVKGSVAVATDAPVTPQIYGLSGTAVFPVTLAPASLTFAAQTVGTTSAAQTITLTNNQNAVLSISFVASGQYAAVGGGTTPCGATVPALGKCTLSVTFTPAKTGSIKGAVTVTHGAANSPQVVGLTGTGQ